MMVPLESPVTPALNMDVSKNNGFSTQIIHFNRVFPYKPSILGKTPLFLEDHPNIGILMVSIVTISG